MLYKIKNRYVLRKITNQIPLIKFADEVISTSNIDKSLHTTIYSNIHQNKNLIQVLPDKPICCHL